jgi:hypothetical protein
VVLIGDTRASDSPFVEEVWSARSEAAGSFLSVATSYWEIVVAGSRGTQQTLTVRGPETVVTPASYEAGGEWIGIRFTRGALFPTLPVRDLVDREVNLPVAGSRTFWLGGTTWQFPNFENADTFVDWLVRDRLLVRDPLVGRALHGDPTGVSERSLQRRFAQAIGLAPSTIRQIDRARRAMDLLLQGVPIADTVDAAGYYDQPHLSRALKRWLGQTPAQIASRGRTG